MNSPDSCERLKSLEQGHLFARHGCIGSLSAWGQGRRERQPTITHSAHISIIGAGPAGLTTAYYLQRRGLAFELIDRLGVGASWARYYDHLRLHTLKDNVALPGLALPRSTPDFPSGAQYYAYLKDYAAHFGFPVREGVEIRSARYEGGRWRLCSSAGALERHTLVLATGIFDTPCRPRLKGEASFRGQLIHARDYRSKSDIAGERVLVVGAGNTGVGIAVALARAGFDTGLVIRSGIQLAPCPRYAWLTRLQAKLVDALPAPLANRLLKGLRRDFRELGLAPPDKPPKEVTPVIGFDLAELLEAGQLRLHPAITQLSEACVHFAGGEAYPYESVVLATGYHPTVDFVEGLELGERGAVLNAPPRLYTVGFYYPAAVPFLYAVKGEAKAVAAQIARAQAKY